VHTYKISFSARRV